MIRNTADYYFKLLLKCKEHQMFITSCKEILINYRKPIHKILFLERLLLNIKNMSDKHMVYCSSNSDCRFNKYYEAIMFYLQSEIDFIESSLPKSYLKRSEISLINNNIGLIIDLVKDLRKTKSSDRLIIIEEISDMKNYYFLNKNIWIQLFIGKVTQLYHRGSLTEQQLDIIIKEISRIKIYSEEFIFKSEEEYLT